ncbi:DUF6207 family protein [Streptomyces spectabilis]|uniref:DUF6207 family protein n=1 Tax=Streptomyces spectabilis TaxID=68270 RepID=UPI0039A57EB5
MLPGLARITVEAADEQAALAVARRLITCHHLTDASAVFRVPGEGGVRVQMYGDATPLVTHPTPDGARSARRTPSITGLYRSSTDDRPWHQLLPRLRPDRVPGLPDRPPRHIVLALDLPHRHAVAVVTADHRVRLGLRHLGHDQGLSPGAP